MKLDYQFLKQLLLAMEENENHTIANEELAKKADVNFKNIDETKFDKLVGHLRQLQDNGCIDCVSADLGFRQNLNDHWTVTRVRYRLTSHGYEFLDMLKKNSILNKVKDFSLTTAYEVGKALLINELSGALK